MLEWGMGGEVTGGLGERGRGTDKDDGERKGIIDRLGRGY